MWNICIVVPCKEKEGQVAEGDNRMDSTKVFKTHETLMLLIAALSSRIKSFPEFDKIDKIVYICFCVLASLFMVVCVCAMCLLLKLDVFVCV